MYIDRAQNFARIDIGLVYQAPLVVEVPGLDGSPMPQKTGAATMDLDPEVVRVRNGTAVDEQFNARTRDPPQLSTVGQAGGTKRDRRGSPSPCNRGGP